MAPAESGVEDAVVNKSPTVAVEQAVKEIDPVPAGEVLSPEEALPEEMAPDQEPPAIAPTQPKPEQPVPDPSHQEEHAQQQELLERVNELRKAAVQPMANSVPVDDATKNKPAENMSRALLDVDPPELKVAPPSAAKTAKVQAIVHINTVKGVARTATSAATQQQQPQQQQQQQQHIQHEEENPPVVTRMLYQPGHRMPLKNICPNQGYGMKLLILVTTAPGHAKQREAVRGTWGHVAFRRDVGFAFMVGRSKNAQENRLVEEENLVYGDVIQVQPAAVAISLPLCQMIVSTAYVIRLHRN